ncbi:MAG: AMP-binding protein [Bacteroidia bacterium]|nr:AMP-binding protein [Bacteroidia bacterium]
MNGNFFQRNILVALCENIEKESYSNSFYINDEYFTYRQLGECISKIRRELVSVEGKVVGIAIHDDIETYASIFALWMEGKAYVPLHPNQPLERNLGIVGQVGLNCIIDSSGDSVYSQWASENRSKLICSSKLVYSGDFLDNWAEVDENELAYLLFTSGSTGTPKGVQITRRNIASFMDSFWKTGIKVDETDRCMQVFDLTFDVSVQNVLVTLTRGACLYTVPYGQVKYLCAASLIQEQKITFSVMAPSMLTYLRPYFDEFDASSMKTCILTAEACPVDLIEDWLKCAKNTEIYDFYGPTEATIYCTYYKLNRNGKNLSSNGIISIGKPLANITAIVIDENGQVISSGGKGELCIAGDQLTLGYWNNSDKNKSAFFEKEHEGKRLRFYHTGDLCFMEKSGNIMYCGRIDQQAKIQGFRVELGEIEFHARYFFKNEKRIVAIAFQNENSLTEIALFIESKKFDVSELLVFLRSKMPAYMIPSRILFEEHFPLNKSEKIDRVALKQMVM